MQLPEFLDSDEKIFKFLREPVKSLNDELYSSYLINEKKQKYFLLLKYLDPYGDTIFNSFEHPAQYFLMQNLPVIQSISDTH